MFTGRNLFVRAVAVILSNSTGYPVGREGPTVTMGSNVAFIITRWVFETFGPLRAGQRGIPPRMRTTSNLSIDLDGNDEEHHEQAHSVFVSLEETQLAHAQRMAGAVGGACAMAMIFDAPIGGVLYMFEEITVFSWPLQLTFRAFVGTMICSLLSHFLINLILGEEVKHFVLWDFNNYQDVWHWADVPFFVILSVVLGRFSVLHTQLALKSGAIRQQMHALAPRHWNITVPFSSHSLPISKMVEAVLFAIATVLIYCFFSFMGRCNHDFKANALVAGSWVQFGCVDGAFNPAASLLLTTSEGAVRRLFSQTHTGYIGPLNLILAFIPYTAMNIALTGVPVPSGNFTGTLLIGAFIGRLMGSLVNMYLVPALPEMNTFLGDNDNFKVEFAVPGVYAMIGAAAMLSGFKQISMGVVVFIVEAANNLSLTPPLMLSVSLSLLINKRLLKSGFDEEQIARKNLDFLHAEPPPGLGRYTAACIMESPTMAIPRRATSDMARRLVLDCEHSNASDELDQIFPVLENGANGIRICHGFTTGKRLQRALDLAEEVGELGFEREPDRWIDYLAYTIPDRTPATKFYSLFSKLRAEVVCVVDDRGDFQGMITRSQVIKYAKIAEEPDPDILSDSE